MMNENDETLKTRGTGNRWIWIALAVLSLLIASLGASAFLMRGKGTVRSPSSIVAAEKTRRIEIAVDGMTCSSCAVGVRSMLKRTDGVLSADASYARKEAVVEYDTSKTDEEKILAAITGFGYGAKIK